MKKRGISKRYTWYGLPESCDTILFPGCTFPGTRPKTFYQLYRYLSESIESLGIVLDCCGNTSHDLGQFDFFNQMFSEMESFLLTSGIQNIITLCPNCYRVFSKYGRNFKVRSVYEILGNNKLPVTHPSKNIITIHDPCPHRFDHHIQGKENMVLIQNSWRKGF